VNTSQHAEPICVALEVIMPGLAGVVSGLAARDGVRVVVVLSEDGLAIEKVAPAAFDVDSLAALSASVIQYANRLGAGTASGSLRTAVLEYDGALLVIELVGSGESLAILAAPTADVGSLLYDLRQHRSTLAALF
jgi:predicted regulator of Ras-like GTPase activity (Roadblock/LC7/MglB family)